MAGELRHNSRPIEMESLEVIVQEHCYLIHDHWTLKMGEPLVV